MENYWDFVKKYWDPVRNFSNFITRKQDLLRDYPNKVQPCSKIVGKHLHFVSKFPN